MVAQHCMEGVRMGKLYFLLLKLVKHQKAHLGLSVSTNFVTDCSLGVGCRVFPSMLG